MDGPDRVEVNWWVSGWLLRYLFFVGHSSSPEARWVAVHLDQWNVLRLHAQEDPVQKVAFAGALTFSDEALRNRWATGIVPVNAGLDNILRSVMTGTAHLGFMPFHNPHGRMAKPFPGIYPEIAESGAFITEIIRPREMVRACEAPGRIRDEAVLVSAGPVSVQQVGGSLRLERNLH